MGVWSVARVAAAETKRRPVGLVIWGFDDGVSLEFDPCRADARSRWPNQTTLAMHR